jgi:hypothetical protein
MLNQNFLWLVPVLSVIGSGSYCIEVLQGRARPNRVTWILWALAPLIAFAAEIHEGVGLQSILTFMAGFGPLMVVVASFATRKAVWKISQFDIICGVVSILGLILWLLTRHGNIAIVFSIVADFMAGVPTIIKAYHDPKSEHYVVFMFGIISSVITVLTIKNWTLANYGFPIYILGMCVLLMALVVSEVGLKLRRAGVEVS